MWRRVSAILCGAVVALAASFSVAKAQSLQSIEDKVGFYLDRINKYRSVSKKLLGGGEDSLGYYNNALRDYLKDVLARQPHTMEYGFDKVGWRLKIASSKDRKFRIYSWDEEIGGPMHMYGSVLQYKAGEQVRSAVYYRDTVIDGERYGPGFYYTDIYPVTDRNTKTYYLAKRRGTYTSSINTVGIQCFAIENGVVNDSVRLFEGKGEFVNSIDVELDLTYVTKEKKMDIEFSSDNRRMYLPQMVDGRPAKRYMIYEFDGERFYYDKVGKN